MNRRPATAAAGLWLAALSLAAGCGARPAAPSRPAAVATGGPPRTGSSLDRLSPAQRAQMLQNPRLPEAERRMLGRLADPGAGVRR